MPTTIEVLQREVRVHDDGAMQSHETHTVLIDGVQVGSFNHVRILDIDSDVGAETQLVRDIKSGIDTPTRRDTFTSRSPQ